MNLIAFVAQTYKYAQGLQIGSVCSPFLIVPPIGSGWGCWKRANYGVPIHAVAAPQRESLVCGQTWGTFVEAAELLGCSFNAHRYFLEAEPIRMPTSYRKTLRKTENQVFGAFVFLSPAGYGSQKNVPAFCFLVFIWLLFKHCITEYITV